MNHEGFIQPGNDYSLNSGVITQPRWFSQLIPGQTAVVRRFWLLCCWRVERLRLRHPSHRYFVKTCSSLSVYTFTNELGLIIINIFIFSGSIWSNRGSYPERNRFSGEIWTFCRSALQNRAGICFQTQVIRDRRVPSKLKFFYNVCCANVTDRVALRSHLKMEWNLY